MENKVLENMFRFEVNLMEEINYLPTQNVHQGEILIKQNSYVKSIPLLLEGNLRVYRHTEDREILFYYIQKSGTCGMTLAACLEGKTINSEIAAVKSSQVIWIPQNKVSEWLGKYKKWNEFIINTFTQRQIQMAQTFDDVAFNKIDKRIKDYLFDLYEQNHNPVISITHQELANELGTTRVVISRILKSLEIDGAIELLRGAIKVIKLT